MMEEKEKEDEECADVLTTDEGDDIIHSTAYTATTCSLLCMEYMVNNSYIVCQHCFTLLGNLYSFMTIKCLAEFVKEVSGR